MKRLLGLMEKIRSGMVPSGATVPDGCVVRGSYEHGHTYALVALPAPCVLVVATTDDRLLRAARFVGRNYFLPDKRERGMAIARLDELYRNTRQYGRDHLEMLFDMYAASLRERVDPMRLTRGVADDPKDLYVRISFVLRTLGRGEEVDYVVEQFRTMYNETTTWASMSLGINYDANVVNPSYVPALRIRVRFRPDGRYRYVFELGPEVESAVSQRKITYPRLWDHQTRLAFSRYLVMRDRTIRRKYGIGWKMPVVLMSAYTERRWGSMFYATPGGYMGNDPNGACRLPIATGGARVTPSSGRLCLYIPSEEYDHLVVTPPWDSGDVLRPNGWDPRQEPTLRSAARFFKGMELRELGVTPYDGDRVHLPYSVETVDALALAYDGDDIDQQELHAILYEDRVLSVLGGEL